MSQIRLHDVKLQGDLSTDNNFLDINVNLIIHKKFNVFSVLATKHKTYLLKSFSKKAVITLYDNWYCVVPFRKHKDFVGNTRIIITNNYNYKVFTK